MVAEVKFTMSIPALDALRRIIQRDFLRDQQEQARALEMPEGSTERMAVLKQTFRNESERGLIERTLGFDGSKDEKGS